MESRSSTPRINFTDSGGNGKPVVLMHGWGCSLQTLASIQATVINEGFRSIAIDFPGFGDTPEPSEVWGVEQYTTSVESLLDELHITNPILLGHSFGGRVGLLMASRRQIDKLILVDAAGVKPRRKLGYYLRVWWFKTSKRVISALFPQQKALTIIEQMRKSRGSSDYSQATPMMRAILSKVVSEDLCHVMPKITAPTLLIWGADDTATPLADAKKMERLIPNAGLVAFENCGHYSFLDNPRGFAAVLKSFLHS